MSQDAPPRMPALSAHCLAMAAVMLQGGANTLPNVQRPELVAYCQEHSIPLEQRTPSRPGHRTRYKVGRTDAQLQEAVALHMVREAFAAKCAQDESASTPEVPSP